MNLSRKLLIIIAATAITAAAADDNELICHPDMPCYPRLFVPTTEFQPVYADQDLPLGLHVRLDIGSGKREAKLNDASDGSISNAIVLHPDSPPTDDLPASAPREPPAHQHTPKPPSTATSDQEILDAALLLLLRSPSSAELLPTLESLADIVHSSYWGLRLAPSYPALTLLLTSSPSPALRATAALIIGSSLSNNAPALHAAGTSLIAPLLTAVDAEQDETALRRELFALSQAMRAPAPRTEFLRLGGVQTLVTVFPKARERIARLMGTVFLDSEMRAEGDEVGEGWEEVCGAFRQWAEEEEALGACSWGKGKGEL